MYEMSVNHVVSITSNIVCLVSAMASHMEPQVEDLRLGQGKDKN